MKNNKKTIGFNNIINLGVSGILILLGILLLIFPWVGIKDSTYLLYLLFTIYGVVKIFEYFVTRAGSDREDLYTGIACILVAISGIIFINYDIPTVLGVTLVSWVGVSAVIKLIKLDYYHDRKDGMFYVNLVTFSFFLLLGILTSINLYYEVAIQTIMLGFFFSINGLLNLAEDSIRIIVYSDLIKKSGKK